MDISIKEIDANTYILNVAEIDQVLERINKLSKKNNYYNRKKLFIAYTTFLNWFIKFVDEERLFRRTYSIEEVINNLFIKKQVIDTQYIRFLLYAAKLYAAKLRENAKISCVKNYLKSICFFIYDVEELVRINEIHRKKRLGINQLIVPRGGYRTSISPFDIKIAANELVFLNEQIFVSDIDFRNISPCSSLLIRQCIELLGKNMLGFSSIHNSQGLIKKMTQIAWNFFFEKGLQGLGWTVTLPVGLSAIKKINQWANNYVHNPWIDKSYIRFLGLEFLYKLMQPVQTNVSCYNGRSYWNSNYGDFRINNYNNLKRDFESYVTSKDSTAIIDWLPLDQVGAYIISL
ncbi:hypothetical protein [Prevotella pallens]|uniref:hypothetical protein n=1 Tax=Prevotella pallens TaxID=60133 RepID=UPI0028E2D58C|nr:hypothetical protein [Prevotella pallens]